MFAITDHERRIAAPEEHANGTYRELVVWKGGIGLTRGRRSTPANRYDPVAFARSLNVEPDPWQRHFLNARTSTPSPSWRGTLGEFCRCFYPCSSSRVDQSLLTRAELEFLRRDRPHDRRYCASTWSIGELALSLGNGQRSRKSGIVENGQNRSVLHPRTR